MLTHQPGMSIVINIIHPSSILPLIYSSIHPPSIHICPGFFLNSGSQFVQPSWTEKVVIASSQRDKQPVAHTYRHSKVTYCLHKHATQTHGQHAKTIRNSFLCPSSFFSVNPRRFVLELKRWHYSAQLMSVHSTGLWKTSVRRISCPSLRHWFSVTLGSSDSETDP